MPKAKVKTKGAVQTNCLEDQLSNKEVAASGTEITLGSETSTLKSEIPSVVAETMDVSVDTKPTGLTVSNIKKTKKNVQKKTSPKISKSKQLKTKKCSRKKAATLKQTVRKLRQPSKNPFESDDDQPLALTTNCAVKNVSAAICETNSLNNKANTEQSVNDICSKDYNHVRKRKKSHAELECMETETSKPTQYTSVIKGESVLVIKKQYPSEEENCSPTKKIKHSIDNILSGHPEVDANENNLGNTSKMEDDRVSEKLNTNSHKDYESIDHILDEINQEILELGQSKCQIDKQENTTSELDDTDNVDSDKTEPYEYSAVSPVSTHEPRARSFSPIPSTSKDNDIFKKNDIRFQESLRLDDDVEIIEPHVETIVVEDGSPGCGGNETIDITAADAPGDDDIMFVGYSRIPNFKGSEIDEILGNKYSDNVNNSDCEIVDVDDVIAEGSAILRRHKRKNSRQTVITQAVTTSPAMAEQPIELEPPLNLINFDVCTRSASPTCIDFLELVPPANPCDPVMASTSSGKNSNDKQEKSISGIIGNYFKKNPVPSTKLSLDNVCSTIGNILEQMTNILGSNNSQTDTTREDTQNLGAPLTTERRQNMLVNNYASHFDDVVETVTLDELSGILPITNVDHYYQHQKQPSYNYGSRHYDLVTTNPVNLSKQSWQSQTHITEQPALVPEPPPSADRGLERSMECPICMENFGSRPLASTICGHIFCMACIQKALSAPDGKKCPTCRKSFKKRGQSYHPLFL